MGIATSAAIHPVLEHSGIDSYVCAFLKTHVCIAEAYAVPAVVISRLSSLNQHVCVCTGFQIGDYNALH